METHLSDEPVWLDPHQSTLSLAGHRLLIVPLSGESLEVILNVMFSMAGPLRYAVKVINGKTRYLTAKAVKQDQAEAGRARTGIAPKSC